MTKPQTLIVNLPFDGFYESHYSGAVDHEESRWIEDKCNESDHDDDESKWPESLRLDESELSNILFDVTDYSAAYHQIARDYVAAFDYVAGEAFGLAVQDARQRYNYETRKLEPETYSRPSIRATFESMDSPREYNFTTDRVYAHIPLAVMRELFKRSKADGHVTLATVIRERFTSYDGFISHYSSALDSWLAKPLADWDHNELGTLLIAAMRLAGADPDSDETRESLYYETFGDDGAYSVWESAVDWERFETKRAETRAEKLAEWIDDDKESALAWREKSPEQFDSIVAAEPDLFRALELPDLPYRCPETIDLFPGNRA